MAGRSQYDLDSFRTLVKTGKTKNEIMAEMAIKNTATVSNLMLRLMNTDKKYYEFKDSTKKVVKVLKTTIGKNNTLTLSAMMLEDSAFKAGDAFVVKVSKNKIVLTLVEE